MDNIRKSISVIVAILLGSLSAIVFIWLSFLAINGVFILPIWAVAGFVVFMCARSLRKDFKKNKDNHALN
ncbi:MAG: hypothetical protein WAV23_01430 [Minisyncoccia bacterium]